MNIKCSDGWLFHEWTNGKCERCGIPIGMNLTDVTSADDLCPFEGHVQVHPVGQIGPHGSVVPLLRLVPKSHDADG
jgi:hypothetical protein